MITLQKKYDIIIVGTGVAGLNCALHLPKDKQILVICKETPDQSDSYLAQGGICVEQGESDFEPYFEDTMRAGHYENNPDTVRCMIENSQEIIHDLISCGVEFAKDVDGHYIYTREGGHGKHRIMYHEDCTGKEITSRLYTKTLGLDNVRIQPYITLIDLLCKDNTCYGIVASDNITGEIYRLYADYVVLATGGIGGLFCDSTNFSNLTGDSVAIALKNKIAIEHIDYIQIHPTTLYSKQKGRRFLISESVRGEGAKLLDVNFKQFTDELQPRDVVTKAILQQMKKDKTEHVWLDMRNIATREEVLRHFPAIVHRCLEEGYDVFKECIPVVPSQHYFMGGVKSGLQGETSMNRLYAVGETCCNGVHGRNRLASNSLLESLLFAKRAALTIGKSYAPLSQEEATLVEKQLNLNDYSNISALKENYKHQIVDEIQKECKRDNLPLLTLKIKEN